MSRYAAPGLYLVPVPIGNRDDMTLRSLKTLQEAELIACEDTRNTGSLLKQYGITPLRLVSLHEHNEKSKTSSIIDAVEEGKVVAYVSDAGTPGISDPGMLLVKEAIERNVAMTVLPGATAFVPALVMSGFSTVPSVFMGFPPAKEGRIAFFEDFLRHKETVVMYEAPHRLLKTLEYCVEIGAGQRKLALCRELSKKFEEVIRGTVEEVLALCHLKLPKGEIVLVFGELEDYS